MSKKYKVELEFTEEAINALVGSNSLGGKAYFNILSTSEGPNKDLSPERTLEERELTKKISRQMHAQLMSKLIKIQDSIPVKFTEGIEVERYETVTKDDESTYRKYKRNAMRVERINGPVYDDETMVLLSWIDCDSSKMKSILIGIEDCKQCLVTYDTHRMLAFNE